MIFVATPRSPWFQTNSLQAQCDKGAWSRGLGLFSRADVVRIQITPQAAGSWAIEGQVQGSLPEPYDVSVELVLAPNGQVKHWSGDCSCPVGADCKHAVALTLEAAQLNPSDGATSTHALDPLKAMRERKEALARAEAEARLVHWLQDWDRALGATRPPAPGARPERPECYLYLVSTVGRSRTTVPQMQLEAVVSYPKVTGGWAKPKQIRTQPGPGQAVYDSASDADRQVLQLLRAMPRSVGYYSAYSVAPIGVLEGAVGLLALEQAAATGRLFVDAGGSTVGAPLRWGDALPLAWSWKESVPAQGGESVWGLQATLPSRSATLCDNHPPLYLDAAHGVCGPVHAEGLSPTQVAMLLQAPALSATALQKHHADLARRIGGVLPLPPVLGPLTRVQGVKPVARLHLAPSPPNEVADMGLITAQLRFDYQGHVGWWAGQELAVLVPGADGGQVLLQRDALAELNAIESLMDLGLLATDEGLFGIPGERSQNDWMHWADNGFGVLRDAGFVLTLDAALDGWIQHADTLDVALQPEGEDEATSPWFALSLGMEINGVRHNILPWLPNLIAAAAAQPPDPATGLPQLPSHVYLPSLNGPGFVRLPTDTLRPWMAALLDLVGDRAHDFQGDSLKLSRLDALRTSAALGEGAVWRGADALRAMVAQLQGASALPEVPVPASVQAELRPYQQQGLNWLQFLSAHGLAGILADDMGLGKTAQALAHLLLEKESGRLDKPALVVLPTSLIFNWKSEAARFAPDLKILSLHGQERKQFFDQIPEYDVVLTTYPLLWRDGEQLQQHEYHLLVLDEAQTVKNSRSRSAGVVRQLKARHRLCLTGTPLENHLGELWAQFDFLLPGFLGDSKSFTRLWRNPIEKQGDTLRRDLLARRLRPFILRRKKDDVATELPPKTIIVRTVELEGSQRDLYETVRAAMDEKVRSEIASRGFRRSQIVILDALLKLRQVCCDPRLVKSAVARKVKERAKLDLLMDMLPELVDEGRRILVFSQFTTMLDLIQDELEAVGLGYVRLTGETQDRETPIKAFQAGEVPIFLISLKAGGVGLNLTAADTVIHYDPWWNPAVENQATDRAHRLGQDKPVFVYKLIVAGSIEEKILALQERKAELAAGILSEDRGVEVKFGNDDLAALFEPLPV